MTSNQIEFAKHKETQRHNVVTEGIEGSKLEETKRHNLQGESVSVGSLEESKRHNLATEQLTNQQIINNYTLGLRQAAAADKQASAAQLSAQASMAHAGAAYRSAEAAMKQAQNTALSIAETNRHNVAMENITDVFNQGKLEIERGKLANDAARNEETKRHNVSEEVISIFEIPLQFAGNIMKGIK